VRLVQADGEEEGLLGLAVGKVASLELAPKAIRRDPARERSVSAGVGGLGERRTLLLHVLHLPEAVLCFLVVDGAPGDGRAQVVELVRLIVEEE
jgi:hypothetical protein